MLRNSRLPVSLLTQFTLVSFFLSATIAVILVLGLQQRLVDDVLRQEADNAADQVTILLGSDFWVANLTSPLSPQRFADLDALVHRDVLQNHIVHVKIWNAAGTVIYSDEPQLVGINFPVSKELAQALAGQVATEVSDLNGPENVYERAEYPRLLEVYIPLHPVDMPEQVMGAYEIYQDMGIVQPIIDDMRRFVTLGVSLGFLILFASLFVLVRKASRELVRSNQDNARLFEETRQQLVELKQAEVLSQRQYQRLLALRAIDEAISAGPDLVLTLKVFLEQATTQLEVDAADILLLDESTGLLNFAAGRGFHTAQIASSRSRLGEDYAGRVAQERRMLRIPDLALADGRMPHYLVSEEGFSAYFAIPLISQGKVKGVLEIFHRTAFEPAQDWLEFFEGLAKQAAIAIGEAELFDSLQRSNIELSRAYDATIEGWMHALDLRDRETEGHTLRVTEMTLDLAAAFGMSNEQMVQIRRGALLHDMGKMGIPDTILLKPGPLTEEEKQIMRKHPVYAYEMLSPIRYLRPALDIPYCHHEKWDGSGYPRGLRGEEIPFVARIFAVVDVWDALTSDRPYRQAWPRHTVRDFVISQKDSHFEPRVVDAFLKIVDESYVRG